MFCFRLSHTYLLSLEGLWVVELGGKDLKKPRRSTKLHSLLSRLVLTLRSVWKALVALMMEAASTSETSVSFCRSNMDASHFQLAAMRIWILINLKSNFKWTGGCISRSKYGTSNQLPVFGAVSDLYQLFQSDSRYCFLKWQLRIFFILFDRFLYLKVKFTTLCRRGLPCMGVSNNVNRRIFMKLDMNVMSLEITSPLKF
jgi:hypothetical protein